MKKNISVTVKAPVNTTAVISPVNTIAPETTPSFSISRVEFHSNSKMPIAILTNNDGREIGYLSPFRGYCFQVSRSIDGEGDMGSSQVIGLNNIWHIEKGICGTRIGTSSNLNWEETKLELLKGQAAIAILNFTGSKTGKFNNRAWTGKITLSNGEVFWSNNSLDYFIHEVAIWLENITYRKDG